MDTGNAQIFPEQFDFLIIFPSTHFRVLFYSKPIKCKAIIFIFFQNLYNFFCCEHLWQLFFGASIHYYSCVFCSGQLFDKLFKCKCWREFGLIDKFESIIKNIIYLASLAYWDAVLQMPTISVGIVFACSCHKISCLHIVIQQQQQQDTHTIFFSIDERFLYSRRLYISTHTNTFQ